MTFLNVEIKAKCNNPAFIRNYLLSAGADFKGVDEQTDTYFKVINGRLKLREGNIENNLIFYERSDQTGPKNSHFSLVKVDDAEGLKEVLAKSAGIKVIVKKRREIYYINNVKFHIDEVHGLGSFIEIEAGNMQAAGMTQQQLTDQCHFYLNVFCVKKENLVSHSYSDLLLF
jgi:predicted adenylyl cyclase CyaB